MDYLLTFDLETSASQTKVFAWLPLLPKFSGTLTENDTRSKATQRDLLKANCTKILLNRVQANAVFHQQIDKTAATNLASSLFNTLQESVPVTEAIRLKIHLRLTKINDTLKHLTSIILLFELIRMHHFCQRIFITKVYCTVEKFIFLTKYN